MLPDLTTLLVLFILALLSFQSFNAQVTAIFQHWVVGTIKHILKLDKNQPPPSVTL